MIRYEDFAIKIEPRQGDAYPVNVLSSPAGEGRSSFYLPIDPDQLGTMLEDVGTQVRGTAARAVREGSIEAGKTSPQKVGDMLFSALFSGAVRSLFDRSLGMLHGEQAGLRVKLHIDPEDPSLTPLFGLPWEFLYQKETRDFLNLSVYTPVVRYLDIQRPCIPLTLEPPLRILVVIASPLDLPHLDLDRERTLIETNLGHLPGVEVDFLSPATNEALYERLQERPYHVLHFMGHGGFDPTSGQGALLLENEERQSDQLSGMALGVLLRDVPSLRLVFLNACDTAVISRQQGLDPFGGVAAALVMAGVVAVVAMQFPITDQAAITFANRFYSLISRGRSVDAAVAEGRRAILVEEDTSLEWGTPVLFMRTPQGEIFRLKGTPKELPQEETQAPPAPSQAKKTVTPPTRRSYRWYYAGGAALVLVLFLVGFLSIRSLLNKPPGQGKENVANALLVTQTEAVRQTQLLAPNVTEAALPQPPSTSMPEAASTPPALGKGSADIPILQATFSSLSIETKCQVSFIPGNPSLPAEVIPEKEFIKIGDQGTEGAAVGFALSGLIYYLTSRQGQPFEASPRMLYEMAKRFDNIPGETGVGTKLCGALTGWANYGVVSIDLWPYVAGQVDRELTSERESAAAAHKPAFFAKVPKGEDTFREAINVYGGILAAGRVHDGWFQPKDGVITYESAYTNPVGNTAIVILGYTSEGFIIANSWGEVWGGINLNGEFYPGMAIWTYPDFEDNFVDAYVVIP